MWFAARALLLVLCISVCAPAQSRTLELYARSAHGLDTQSRLMMRLELQRLLEPAAIQVVWKSPGQIKTGEYFDFVAVSSFEGACSVADPSLTPVSDTSLTLSLAGTSTSDGHVLPFFTVDCARLTRMLKPEFARMGVMSRQFLLGRALARVMAHEIYHVIAKTTYHAEAGLAKAVFSVSDLTMSKFEFDTPSLDFMRAAQVAHVSGSEDGSFEIRTETSFATESAAHLLPR